MFGALISAAIAAISGSVSQRKRGTYNGLGSMPPMPPCPPPPVYSLPAKRPTLSQLSLPREEKKKDDEDIATSMIVGMATDNAALGYLAGGSLIGGMMGQAMADSMDSSPTPDTSTPIQDSSPSSLFDSGSSYDSSSSSDSGSGGGGASDSW